MEDKKENIDSVHEDDLEVFLKKIGLLEEFLDNKIKCKFCDDLVTKENVYSILPQSGSFHLVCNKPECVMKLSEHINERKNG